MYNKTLELGKFDFKDKDPKDAKAPPKECPVETMVYPGCSSNCCLTVEMIDDATVLKAVKKDSEEYRIYQFLAAQESLRRREAFPNVLPSLNFLELSQDYWMVVMPR